VDNGIPHAWNDLDMLEVCNGGMTDEEYKTHFSMWAAVKPPRLMGNNIAKLKPQDLSVLNNPALVAVNQNPAGSSAVRIWRYYVDDTDEYGQGEI
jgi:alpha-galactosidase